MANYATESDLKEETDINTSEFARKTDLASLKSVVNDLVIDKLKTVPLDLSKLLINVVKNDVV